jgi:hypothetical protein
MQRLRNAGARASFAIQRTPLRGRRVSHFAIDEPHRPARGGTQVGMLKNLKLRHRAYVSAYNSFRFAAKLRGDLSEFAPSIAETLESVGDELAALARDSCPTEGERRQLIDGLEGALRALGLSDAAQVHIVSQLAPRIMAGEPASASKEAWTRMAV